ncbi:hypothetical protein F9C28_10525 [Shimwellia pseudoproteus]|uniref:YqjK-like family protein n=1 Tax=Shimwellia pseudoproteus TaxID=570012 RepID=UPI0018EBA709|nr:YqjK-like family protein [Shimwellia pseudoproteus]MBJ3815346.1 hypothetical protein [Shimwellia pseudoproteus]
MSARLQREARKAALLAEVSQQRQALKYSCQDWVDATAPLDRGWYTLQSLRAWLMAGSSVVALWGIRHPRFLGRTLRRGLGLWSSWRLVRKALHTLSR